MKKRSRKKYRIRKNSIAYYVRGAMIGLAVIAVMLLMGMTDCPVCHDIICSCGK